jgi:hypothetical protein
MVELASASIINFEMIIAVALKPCDEMLDSLGF